MNEQLLTLCVYLNEKAEVKIANSASNIRGCNNMYITTFAALIDEKRTQHWIENKEKLFIFI